MSETSSLDYVLDAWALMAFFGNEQGSQRIHQILKSAEQGGCTVGLSIINLGEIAYITERERGLAKAHKTLAVIRSLPMAILPVDEKIVLTAAHIKANHRLSYADAIAAATTKIWSAVLVTGDLEFKTLAENEISIEWLLNKSQR